MVPLRPVQAYVKLQELQKCIIAIHICIFLYSGIKRCQDIPNFSGVILELGSEEFSSFIHPFFLYPILTSSFKGVGDTVVLEPLKNL